MNKITIDSGELKNINKPARYVGGEVNQIIKNRYKCSIVLCYPNVYEKAMSNYMVRLLYTNLNNIDGVYCKRCFAPEMDFEKYLLYNNYELYSLEDRVSIKESKMLLFLVDNELDYTNFLNMLRRANINFNKEKREKTDPKIVVLPLGNVNLKPIEKFVDKIMYKKENEEKRIEELMIYVKEVAKLSDDKEHVKIEYPTTSIVPSIKIEEPGIIIDLSLVDDINEIVKYVKESIKLQGITKVAFVNQDGIDNIKLCELVYRLKAGIQDIRISGKRLDFSKFSVQELSIILPCIERSGLEFNVITCSNSLIAKTNIGIPKEELLEKIGYIFKNNRSSVRLVFNIGLPKETYEDIDDIFNTVEEIVNIYAQSRAKDKLSMIVKINCYIPKLNEKNRNDINSINKLETKIRYIKEKEHDSVIKVNMESIDMYATKILLKNGNEDISDIIVSAYELGARFDRNGTPYSVNAWDKAIYDNSHIVNKYTKNNI